jgi:hypothetical protein
MKTHKINPNDIRGELANFTIEFRFKQIPPLEGAPSCQRFMRLTEIPMFSGKPRKTVWHEIYSYDLVTSGRFAKWVKDRGHCFRWNGKPRDIYRLTIIMAEMASPEVVRLQQKQRTKLL